MCVRQEKHEAARSVPPLRIVVRRSHIFEDGLEQLAGADWRARFQVVFVNALGRPEQGQDVGGLFKEFWEKLAETAFNPDYGLFRSTESRLLYPNPEACRCIALVCQGPRCRGLSWVDRGSR